MATAEIDDWATLDRLLGIEVEAAPVEPVVDGCAFYGRCSTEDNQDPETSRGWQLANARRFVEPLGGRIVAEFFDIGQSRSVPWDRRTEGARLLAALKDPARTWSAMVVGEGTRCWFGNQFSLIAPRLAAHGVELWVPELGGRYDPRNPSHKMLMGILGGMSESERQHVQARVRAAMDVQVVNEGRHQGGRAPYGYVVVDGGAHPNPRKAAEGYRLRRLAIDEPAAEVVRRIFRQFVEGDGVRAIAAGLNGDGIACPSARRPDQNRHRLADGWQGSTIHAILENPRYTGYAVFGRWVKVEKLADPDDVAAGHVVRFERAAPDKIVRSRQPAHPAIVSVADFTRVQVERRMRSSEGMRGMATRPRSGAAAERHYLLRGLVQCAICRRKMQGGSIRRNVYYRCTARRLAPGSAALAEHPKTVNLREDVLTGAINGWIGLLFSPEKRDDTVRALVESQGGVTSTANEDARTRLRDAEETLRRLQAAIVAGIDPAAVKEPMNAAQAQREAARVALAAVPPSGRLDVAEVYAMIDALGDVGEAIKDARPESLTKLYKELGIKVSYRHEESGGEAVISLVVANVRVRGGT